MSPPNSSERKRLWANGLRSRLRNWFCRSHDVSNVKLKVGEAETSEVTAAVMAHILSRPDSIRQRAQNAATISGALAVALVVASVTGLTDESESFGAVTQGLVFGAIVVFALSTLFSVHAVAFPHSYKPKDGTKEDDDGTQGDDDGTQGDDDGTKEDDDGTKEDDYQELVRQYEEYADEVR